MSQKDIRDERGMSEEEFLAQYDPGDYERPAVTVDMLIFTVNPERRYALELLLIERGGHPFLGKWAIPGGFVDMEESLEEAAVRELREETGLSDIYMEQLFTFGDVGRDPRMRVISVAYMALLSKERLRPVAGDDAAKVCWFTVKQEENGGLKLIAASEEDSDASGNEGASGSANAGTKETARGTATAGAGATGSGTAAEEKPLCLTEEDLAFDHAKLIRIALQRLKNKVEYTDIAFELAGEKFTLTQLQMIFEAILGKELHKPNFRRGIAPRVEKTEEMETKHSNRPSYYYRKKAEKGGSFYE